MFKRVLCIMISLMMVFSLRFTFVFAENEESSNEEQSSSSAKEESSVSAEENNSSTPTENESSDLENVGLLEILTCTEGYTSLSVGTHEYKQQVKEIVELIPNTGYSVYGVEIDGVFSELDGNTIEINIELGKKVSIRPVFRGNIVFHIEQRVGGKISPEGTVYVGSTKSLDVIATPDIGYKCSGIYINGVGVEVVKEGKVYKAVINAREEKEYNVYAIFEPLETHTVTLNKTEGGKVIPFDENGKSTVFSGEDAQFQAVPEEGYGIKSIVANGKSLQWSADGVFIVENVTADFEISIEFVQMASIPVSVQIAGKGKITAVEKAYENTKLVLDVFADEGYELVSVKVNNTPVTLNKNGKIEIDINTEIFSLGKLKIDVVFDVIVEKFIINTVIQNKIGGTITADGYIIENDRIQIRKGSSVTLTFTPDMNYMVERVKVDGTEVNISSSNTLTFNNVKESHYVIVYFAPSILDGEEFYKISVESTIGGTVSPSSEQIILQGQSITFNFTPDEGYKVDYIILNGERKAVTDNFYTFDVVVSDQSLKVVFAQDSNGGNDFGENEVVIDITDSYIVGNDLFDEIKNEYNGKTVILKGNKFSWKFPPNYQYPESNLDFTVLIGKDNFPKEIIEALENKMMASKIQGLDFEAIKTSGVSLSDDVKLKLSLGSNYANKVLDYLFYDSSSQTFSSVIEEINSKYNVPKYTSSQVIVDSNGNVELPYNNNEYIILVVSTKSKYTLNVIAGENGSVSPRGTTIVPINSTQIIQITPDSGYMVENIIVNGTSMYQEFFGRTTSFAISLGKISEDYTIEVFFAPADETSSSNSPTDISSSGGLKPWVAALIIIGLAIGGGVVLFIYKWNEEKDIVD